MINKDDLSSALQDKFQTYNKRPKLRLVEPVQDPIEVETDDDEDHMDITKCAPPRRRWLIWSVTKMSFVGLVSNVALATIAHSILAQPAAELGLWVEGQGLQLGRDVLMTGLNFQGAAWMVLMSIAMMINVGIVFHLSHDAALEYQFRAWAVRMMAYMVTSLDAFRATEQRIWARRILERSKIDRLIGWFMLVFIAAPLYLFSGIVPWGYALVLLGNPPVATIVTAILVVAILFPSAAELFGIGAHIRGSEADDEN